MYHILHLYIYITCNQSVYLKMLKIR